MKKKIYYLLVCVMAVLSGAYFVSCSSDSDGGSSSNPLVGTWYYDDDDSYSGTDREYVMFCSDGTMYVFEKCSTHGAHVDMGTYIYDEDTKRITIIEDGSYRSETAQILSIDKNSFTIRTGSGYAETYKKTNSPFSASQLKKYYLADIDYSSY